MDIAVNPMNDSQLGFDSKDKIELDSFMKAPSEKVDEQQNVIGDINLLLKNEIGNSEK